MWHVGIDLHRATVVMAAVNDVGEAMDAIAPPRMLNAQFQSRMRITQPLLS